MSNPNNDPKKKKSNKKASSFTGSSSLDKIDERLQNYRIPKAEGFIPFDKNDTWAPGDNNAGRNLLSRYESGQMDFERARNQPFYEQAWHASTKFLPRVATEVVKGAGYGLEGLGYLITDENQMERDYDNEIIRGMEQFGEALNDFSPIYKERPGEMDFTDFGYLSDNVSQMGATAASFFVSGGAIGKGIGALTKGLGTYGKAVKGVSKGKQLLRLAQAGKMGDKMRNFVNQMGTAASLSYLEGAASGAQVYEDIYKKGIEHIQNTYEKGSEEYKIAESELRLKAGEAANEAVLMNVAVNTPLQLTSVKAFTRGYNGTRGALSSGTVKKIVAGRTPTIKGLSGQPMTKKELGAAMLREMPQESLEELVNVASEKYGTKYGESLLLGNEGNANFIDSLIEAASSAEGAESMIWGALLGGMQTGISHTNPVGRKARKKFFSDVVNNAMENNKSFESAIKEANNITKATEADEKLTNYQQDSDVKTKAQAKYVKDKIYQEQFAESVTNAMENGTLDALEAQIETMKENEVITNEEAMYTVDTIRKLEDNYESGLNLYGNKLIASNFSKDKTSLDLSRDTYRAVQRESKTYKQGLINDMKENIVDKTGTDSGVDTAANKITTMLENNKSKSSILKELKEDGYIKEDNKFEQEFSDIIDYYVEDNAVGEFNLQELKAQKEFEKEISSLYQTEKTNFTKKYTDENKLNQFIIEQEIKKAEERKKAQEEAKRKQRQAEEEKEEEEQYKQKEEEAKETAEQAKQNKTQEEITQENKKPSNNKKASSFNLEDLFTATPPEELTGEELAKRRVATAGKTEEEIVKSIEQNMTTNPEDMGINQESNRQDIEVEEEQDNFNTDPEHELDQLVRETGSEEQIAKTQNKNEEKNKNETGTISGFKMSARSIARGNDYTGENSTLYKNVDPEVQKWINLPGNLEDGTTLYFRLPDNLEELQSQESEPFTSDTVPIEIYANKDEEKVFVGYVHKSLLSTLENHIYEDLWPKETEVLRDFRNRVLDELDNTEETTREIKFKGQGRFKEDGEGRKSFKARNIKQDDIYVNNLNSNNQTIEGNKIFIGHADGEKVVFSQQLPTVEFDTEPGSVVLSLPSASNSKSRKLWHASQMTANETDKGKERLQTLNGIVNTVAKYQLYYKYLQANKQKGTNTVESAEQLLEPAQLEEFNNLRKEGLKLVKAYKNVFNTNKGKELIRDDNEGVYINFDLVKSIFDLYYNTQGKGKSQSLNWKVDKFNVKGNVILNEQQESGQWKTVEAARFDSFNHTAKSPTELYETTQKIETEVGSFIATLGNLRHSYTTRFNGLDIPSVSYNQDTNTFTVDNNSLPYEHHMFANETLGLTFDVQRYNEESDDIPVFGSNAVVVFEESFLDKEFESDNTSQPIKDSSNPEVKKAVEVNFNETFNTYNIEEFVNTFYPDNSFLSNIAKGVPHVKVELINNYVKDDLTEVEGSYQENTVKLNSKLFTIENNNVKEVGDLGYYVVLEEFTHALTQNYGLAKNDPIYKETEKLRKEVSNKFLGFDVAADNGEKFSTLSEENQHYYYRLQNVDEFLAGVLVDDGLFRGESKLIKFMKENNVSDNLQKGSLFDKAITQLVNAFTKMFEFVGIVHTQEEKTYLEGALNALAYFDAKATKEFTTETAEKLTNDEEVDIDLGLNDDLFFPDLPDYKSLFTSIDPSEENVSKQKSDQKEIEKPVQQNIPTVKTEETTELITERAVENTTDQKLLRKHAKYGIRDEQGVKQYEYYTYNEQRNIGKWGARVAVSYSKTNNVSIKEGLEHFHELIKQNKNKLSSNKNTIQYHMLLSLDNNFGEIERELKGNREGRMNVVRLVLSEMKKQGTVITQTNTLAEQTNQDSLESDVVNNPGDEQPQQPDQEITIDELVAGFEKDQWGDDVNFQLNVIKSASGRLRRAIGGLVRKTPQGKPVTLNGIVPVFYDENLIFNELLRTSYNADSFSEIVELLGYEVDNGNTRLKDVYELFKIHIAKDEKLRNEVFTVLSSQQISMTLTLRDQNVNGKTVYKTFIVNKNNLNEIITSKWAGESVGENKIFNYNNKGEPIFNKDMYNKVINKFNKFQEKYAGKIKPEQRNDPWLSNDNEFTNGFISELRELMAPLGISFTGSDEQLRRNLAYQLKTANKRNRKNSFRAFVNTDIKYIFRNLSKEVSNFNKPGTENNNLIKNEEFTDLFNKVNPIVNSSSKIQTMAAAQAMVMPMLHNTNFRLDGKSYYSYAKNNLLTQTFKNFKKEKVAENSNGVKSLVPKANDYFKQLYSAAFNSNNEILNTLFGTSVESEQLKTNFNLTLPRGVKPKGKQKVNTIEIDKFSIRDYESTRVNLTLKWMLENQNVTYVLPTLSDKKTIYSIEGLKGIETPFTYKVDENGKPTTDTYKLSDTIFESVRFAVEAEMNRIRQVEKEVNDESKRSHLVEGYHYAPKVQIFNEDGTPDLDTNGNPKFFNVTPDTIVENGVVKRTGAGFRFMIFDFLNDDSRIFDSEGYLRNDIDMEYVKGRVLDYLEELANNKYYDWSNMSDNNNEVLNMGKQKFFDNDLMNAAMKKVKNFAEGESQGKEAYLKEFTYKYLALNYEVNSLINHVNFLQMFGDPALAGKPVAEFHKNSNIPYRINNAKTQSKTWDNVRKRNASIIAPGKDLNTEDVPSVIPTVILEDVEPSYNNEDLELLLEQYPNLTKDKAKELMSVFTNIPATDAQEIITFQEALDTMRSEGKITKGEAQRAHNRNGTGVFDSISNYKKAVENNDPLVNKIFNPFKPVYSGLHNTEVENPEKGISAVERHYIKCADVILIPAFTEGKELDKLRKAMEKNNIRRAAYTTAQKLGTKGVKKLNIYNDDGTIKNEGELNSLFANKDHVHNYDRKYLRIQQEAKDEIKGKNTRGTQEIKLIFQNWDGTHKFNKSLIKDFKEALGSDSVDGNTLRKLFLNAENKKLLTQFNNLLGELGAKRDEGGKVVSLDKNKVRRVLIQELERRDLSENARNSLRTIVKGNAIDWEVPIWLSPEYKKFETALVTLFTSRLIQQKVTGTSGIMVSEMGISFDKTQRKSDFTEERESIKWTTEDGLPLDRPLRMNEVIMPSVFVDKDGKTIDLTKADIDSRLLEQNMGFRIPTQGYNSMSQIKIVGFLPAYMGTTMITNKYLNVTTGSDYDVDKFNVYFHNYNVEELDNGRVKITKLEYPKVEKNNDGELLNTALDEFTVEQLENFMLDIRVGILQDESTLPYRLSPDSFGELPSVADEVETLLEQNAKSRQRTHVETSATTHNQVNTVAERKAYMDGQAGKQGIGTFSLWSIFVTKLQQANVVNSGGILFADDSGKRYKDEITDEYKEYFTDEEGRVKDPNRLWKFGKIRGISSTISDTIRYFQSASVDNAKNPILGKLNLNLYTFNTAAYLAIHGLPETSIAYFLNQPSIRDMSRFIELDGDSFNLSSPNSDRYVKDTIRNYVETQAEQNNNKLTKEQIDKEVEKIQKESSRYAFSNDNLKNLMSGQDSVNVNYRKHNKDSIMSVDYELAQMLLLQQFNTYRKEASTLYDALLATRQDQDGLGVSVATALNVRLNKDNINKAVDKFFNIEKTLKDMDLALNPNEYGRLPYTPSGLIDRLVYDNLEGMFKDFSLLTDLDLISAVDRLEEIIGKKITKKDKENFLNDFSSYLVNQIPELVGVNPTKTRQKLLYDPKNNIVEQYNKLKKIKLNNTDVSITDSNLLLASLVPNIDKKRGNLATLQYDNAKQELDENDITAAWSELFVSENKQVQNFAKDLATYTILTGANSFGVKSFYRFLPHEYLASMNKDGGITKFAETIKDNIDTSVIDNYIDEYIQHNPYIATTILKEYAPNNISPVTYDMNDSYTVNDYIKHNEEVSKVKPLSDEYNNLVFSKRMVFPLESLINQVKGKVEIKNNKIVEKVTATDAGSEPVFRKYLQLTNKEGKYSHLLKFSGVQTYIQGGEEKTGISYERVPIRGNAYVKEYTGGQSSKPLYFPNIGKMMGFRKNTTTQEYINYSPYEQAIEIYEAELDRLEKNFKNNKDAEAFLDKQWLKQTISLLRSNKNMTPAIDFGLHQTKQIIKMLNDNPNASQIKLATNIVAAYENMFSPDNFSTSNSELKERVDKLRVRTAEAKELVVQKRDQAVYNIAQQNIEDKEKLEEMAHYVDGVLKIKHFTDDDNTLSMWSLDISKSKNIFNQLVGTMIDKIQNITKKQLRDFNKDYDELFKKFKAARRGSDNIWEIFYEKDKNGENTGRLVSQYTNEYYETKNKKFKDKNIGWEIENHITYSPDKDNKNYSSDADNKFQAFQEEYEVIYAKYGETQPEVVEYWAAKNDPRTYIAALNMFKDGTNVKEALAALRNFEGYNFLHQEPVNKWVSNQWETIQNGNEDIKNMYQFIQEQTVENYNKLPVQYDLDGNEISKFNIYELNKSFAEDLKSDNVTKHLGHQLGKAFNNAISENINSRTQARRDPYTGQPIFDIPVPTQYGREAKDKSLDLGTVLKYQTEIALNYEAKQSIQGELELISDVVTNNKLQQNGSITDGSNSNSVKMLRTHLNHYLYGEHRKRGEGKLGIRKLTPVEKEREKKLLKKREELVQLRDESISSAVRNKLKTRIESLDKELDQLGREITLGKIADTLNNYVRALGLSWRLTSFIIDVSFGGVSNLVHAAGGQDFTTKDYMKAMAATLKRTGSKYTNQKKILMFKELLNVDMDYTENNPRKNKVNDAIYYLQKQGGNINNNTTTVAVLMATKVPGSEKSIWESFDEQGNWVGDVPNPYVQQNNSPSKNMKGELTETAAKLGSKVNVLITNIHGNFDPNKPVYAKKFIFGRLLLAFRSWLPNAYAARFGQKYYSEALGREEYGRLRNLSEWAILGKDSRAYIAARFTNSPHGLNDVQLAHVKKNLREAMLTVGLWAATMVLTNLAGDDDEDKNFATKFALNQLNRLQRDLMMFYNPESLYDFAGSPVPALTGIYGIQKTGQEWFKWATSPMLYEDYETEYKNGTYLINHKPTRRLAKSIPIISGGVGTVESGMRTVKNISK